MSFTINHRFLISAATLVEIRSNCEVTEDFVWIGSKGSKGKQRLRRHTIRGVPAKHIDLALPETVEQHLIAVEIGKKSGRYDGAVRTHISIRYWKDANNVLPYGDFRIVTEDACNVPPDSDGFAMCGEGQWIVCSAHYRERTVTFPELPPMGEKPGKGIRHITMKGGSWIEAHQQLLSSLDGYELPRIVMWHWNHFYTVPLTFECAQDVATEFEIVCPRTVTLAEANRLASRMLYKAATLGGWRKLTLRERTMYRFDNQWVKNESVLKRRAEMEMGTTTGCGQYTIEAANGIVTSYGVFDGEG